MLGQHVGELPDLLPTLATVGVGRHSRGLAERRTAIGSARAGVSDQVRRLREATGERCCDSGRSVGRSRESAPRHA
jgi:hypothetical protein